MGITHDTHSTPITAADYEEVHLIDTLTMPEGSAPSTPASGKAVIYVKTDGRVYSKDDAGTEYGPFDTGGGGAATIVQGQYGVTGGSGDIVLGSAPTTGNKLILLKGSWNTTCSATGFTEAITEEYTNRRATLLYRDVQGGDSATRPFVDTSNGWYCMIEVAGLATGNATLTMSNDVAVFTPLTGTAMSIPSAGFTVVLGSGGTASASPYIPAPAKLLTMGYGLSNGGNTPFCNAASAFHLAAETFTPSFPNAGGFTGDGCVAAAFWPFA